MRQTNIERERQRKEDMALRGKVMFPQSPDMINDVAKFHHAFGHPVLWQLSLPSQKRRDLRSDLISEEANELIKAIEDNDLTEIADGCADLIYVVIGTCLEYGIPLDLVWKEVQRSNMAKLGSDGKPLTNSVTGKTMKPADWQPPAIKELLLDFTNLQLENKQ